MTGLTCSSREDGSAGSFYPDRRKSIPGGRLAVSHGGSVSCTGFLALASARPGDRRGLSAGLFVAAAAQANERALVISSTVLLVLVSGAVAVALLCRPRPSTTAWVGARESRQRGLRATYTAVWAPGVLTALQRTWTDRRCVSGCRPTPALNRLSSRSPA